ncbi:MAG: hypothetical protein NDI73_05960, partial [Desulfuromonadales bacterium]|nr:hypothetical protein [Desulfuromonadales bacterium]
SRVWPAVLLAGWPLLTGSAVVNLSTAADALRYFTGCNSVNCHIVILPKFHRAAAASGNLLDCLGGSESHIWQHLLVQSLQSEPIQFFIPEGHP